MSKKKKSPWLAIGIVGAVIAYTMFSKKSSTAADPGITYDPGSGTLTDDGTGTGTQVIQPPPIVAPTETVTNLMTAAAIADRDALLRYSTDPVFQKAVKLMNDAETINTYNYVFGYVILGKKLYQYPNSSGIFADGGWDTSLYNAIAAIKVKYKIF